MGEPEEDTEETNLRPKRVATDPGLGVPSSGGRARSPVGGLVAAHDDRPVANNFDALHAALGDPLDDDRDSDAGATIDIEADEHDDLLDGLSPEEPERVEESSGRLRAAYASSRPHTIPSSHTPSDDLNVPPVIVAREDTVPSGPPQPTLRLGHSQAPGTPARSFPAYSRTPLSVPIQRVSFQETARMSEPPPNPRPARNPTVFVRERGPSSKQKLVVFMAMLLLVMACGLAMIVWREPRWLGLEPATSPTPESAESAESVALRDNNGASPLASGQQAAAPVSAPAPAATRAHRPRPVPAALLPPPPTRASAGR